MLYEVITRINDIARRHDLVVCSDEIHCDLLLDDVEHIPFASLNEDAASRSAVLMAPSKTFNIAGLCCSFAIIPRITSYNVCYTKLLRINKYLGKDFVVKSSVGHVRDLPTSGGAAADNKEGGKPATRRGKTTETDKQRKEYLALVNRMGVITSYSIHYTKLYETAGRDYGKK